jgi:hypothetical protein
MTFQPKFLATAIGSMPFEKPDEAVDVSLRCLSEAPIWPQMPKFGLLEQMEVQYSEGMPCAVVDREKQRLYFQTDQDYSEAFAGFYEAYLAAADPESGNGDFSAFAIGEEYAHGLHALQRRLRTLGRKLPFVKCQTTGPCSFALTIVDENKRALYYNEEFLDVVVKALAAKSRWQIRLFRPFADGIICFIDEPILSAFGSSTYVSVKRDDVVARMGEVIQAVQADGALAGVHCCGNTEWSILIDAGVDIVNFDAFGFGETIAMYAPAVKAHLERGGVLAWGIVPTSTAIREQTAGSLVAKLEKLIDHLASKGIDRRRIVEQAMVTPSCGTGSMDAADARKVFDTLAEVSRLMKAKYGF